MSCVPHRLPCSAQEDDVGTGLRGSRLWSGEPLGLGGQFPVGVAGVDDAVRLQQQGSGLGRGTRTVLNAAQAPPRTAEVTDLRALRRWPRASAVMADQGQLWEREAT